MSDQEASESDDHGGDADRDADDLPSDLVERIATHDEGLAEGVAALRDRLGEVERELAEAREDVDDLTGRLKRARADFENYKKRKEREREAVRARATERLVERLVEVRNDLRRAIDAEDQGLEDLLEGVKLTLRELDRILDAEDVAEIAPEPGTPVDPERHEVLMRVESDEPPETVAEVYEPGYEQAGRVIRAAKVTVSDGPPDDAEE